MMPARPHLSDRQPSTDTQKEMASVVGHNVRPTLQRNRGCAYRPLMDDTPIVKLGDSAVSAAIAMHAFANGTIGIVDLGFDQGAAWIALFKQLRDLNKSPRIHLVAVCDTLASPDPAGREQMTRSLSDAAARAGIEFYMQWVDEAPDNWPAVPQINCDQLYVNANFSLHHIVDDGFHRDSTRTIVLRRIRRMNPTKFFVCEPDFGPSGSTHAGGFGSQFDPITFLEEVLTDMVLAATPEGITPPVALIRGACPAPTPRPELPDRSENWSRRFYDAGFDYVDLSPLRGLIVRPLRLPTRAIIRAEPNGIRLHWQGKPIVHVSAWQPTRTAARLA